MSTIPTDDLKIVSPYFVWAELTEVPPPGLSPEAPKGDEDDDYSDDDSDDEDDEDDYNDGFSVPIKEDPMM